MIKVGRIGAPTDMNLTCPDSLNLNEPVYCDMGMELQGSQYSVSYEFKTPTDTKTVEVKLAGKLD